MRSTVFFGVLLIIFICFSKRAISATYYFSVSSGSDAFTSIQAQNPATPWKSLNRLNSYFKNLNAGDSVLFNRGDVFFGSITVNKSGGVFAPIYIGAYGHGDKPEISGLATLKNWTVVKPGIYESPFENNGNTLLINGVQQAIGRYPNKGYITYQSHQDNSSISDNLSNLTNWTGAEVVIRKNRWVIDKSIITSQNGGTINYEAGTKGMPTNGYGYFVQKSIKTLDQFGEWFYDTQNNKMVVYFGGKNPNAYLVKASAVNTLVAITKYDYITFENLSFVGSGSAAFNIINSKKIILNKCNLNLSGAEALLASYSPFITVTHCAINHSLSGGINLDAGCSNSTLSNNLIKNTGLIPGLGKSGTGTYEGITSFGDNTVIEKNNIDSTGYNGIYFGGNTAIAKNNYITYFCLTKDDGAGIYIGDWSKTVNKKVVGNIVLHGIGNSSGVGNSRSMQAEGIYIDDNTESVTITGNTVSNCANNGIKIHNAKDIKIVNNNVYNNGVQLRLEQDHYLSTSTYIRNNEIRNNTFFSQTSLQPTAKFSTHQDDIPSFGQLDSNFYNKPKKECLTIGTASVKNGKGIKVNCSLVNWKTAYGKDECSVELTAEAILFEYNATDAVKTIILDQSYVDVHNKLQQGTVTIKPYSSIILVAKNHVTKRQPTLLSAK